MKKLTYVVSCALFLLTSTAFAENVPTCPSADQMRNYHLDAVNGNTAYSTGKIGGIWNTLQIISSEGNLDLATAKKIQSTIGGSPVAVKVSSFAFSFYTCTYTLDSQYASYKAMVLSQ